MATDDVRLIHGDCLDVLRTLEPGSVDAVITDPPYGMNWRTDSTRFSGGRHRRGAGRRDYGRIVGDDSPFDPSPWLAFRKVVLFGANHYASRLPVGTTLVWIKRADHLFGTFLSDAEIAWQKGGYGVYCYRKQFPSSTRAKELGGRCSHPTQKPLGLMEWCIRRLKLPPASTILDPYMGTGTTGVAALRCGHKFIGVELDQGYYEIACRRIVAECERTAMFAAEG